MHVTAARKKGLEHLASRLAMIVIKIHLPQVLVKGFYLRPFDPKVLYQYIGKVLTIKTRPHIHLRVNKADVLELMDRVRNLFGPILATRFHHPIGKAMQGYIKNVPPAA